MTTTVVERAMKCLDKQGRGTEKRFSKYLPTLEESGPIDKFSTPELVLALELTHRGIPVRHHIRLVGHWEADLYLDFEPDNRYPCGIDIECDGRFWHAPRENRLKDRRRDVDLSGHHVLTLRFAGEDIERNVAECADVIERTYRAVKDHPEILNQPAGLMKTADLIRIRRKNFGFSEA